MAHVTDLPDKILDRISSFLSNSPNALSAFSKTCKRLSYSARRALNSHICLGWRLSKHSQVLRFAAGNQGNDIVESIRIKPQASQLNAFNLSMAKAYDQLDELCACLSSLPNLSTFSLRVDCADENNLAVERQLMPEKALVNIIRALPPCVVNLELDTARLDGMWKSELSAREAHLCDAISTLLPQLETLFLQVSSICDHLLQSFYAHRKANPREIKLRRVGIKLSAKFDHYTYMPLSSTNCVNADRFGKKLKSANNLFYRLLKLEAAGKLPDLERFILFSIPQTQTLEVAQIMVQDVASRSMVKCPFNAHVEKIGGELMNSSGAPFSREQLRYVFRVPVENAEKDYFGRFEDMESILLHEVLWKESENGNRTPPMGKISKDDLRLDTCSLVGTDIVKSHLEMVNRGAVEQSSWRRMSSLRIGPAQMKPNAVVQHFEPEFDCRDEPDISRGPPPAREQSAIKLW